MWIGELQSWSRGVAGSRISGDLPNLGVFRKYHRISVLFSKLVKNTNKKKASERYQTLKKLPKIAQNFYIFFKSAQKSSRFFFTNSTELFRFCQKKLPNSGEISIWQHLCLLYYPSLMNSGWIELSFHQLGRVGLVAAMSVRSLVDVPFPCNFFLRPLIGPMIT